MDAFKSEEWRPRHGTMIRQITLYNKNGENILFIHISEAKTSFRQVEQRLISKKLKRIGEAPQRY
jgi:hypothetical protein